MKKRIVLIGVLVALSAGVLARYFVIPKEVVESVPSDGAREVRGPWVALPETEITLAPGEKVEMTLTMGPQGASYKFRRGAETRNVALASMPSSEGIEPNPDRGGLVIQGSTACTYTPENKSGEIKTFRLRVRRFWNEVNVTREATYWSGRVEKTRFVRKQALVNPQIDMEIDLATIR